MKYHTWENIEDLASSGGHKALFPAYVVVVLLDFKNEGKSKFRCQIK